jgi:GNAT superfamily N-acetyltransferase
LTVIGYYSLVTSSIVLPQAPSRLRRNMLDPMPVILLGRLAVDNRHQGRGLGVSLLQDAFLRCAVASSSIGVRAILVHAIDDAARSYCQNSGFVSSPVNEFTMFIGIEDVRAATRQTVEGDAP